MGLARLHLPATPTVAPPVPLSPRVTSPLQSDRGGPGSVIALPSGSVASDIRPIDVDRRTSQARYEVLVANDSVSPVVAFAYAVTGAPGSHESTTVSSFTVPAYTSVASEILVQLPAHGDDPRVVVEVLADNVHLTLDASPPRRRPWRWARGTATTTILAALAAATLLYVPNRTSVLALAAPDHVRAGESFTVVYAARSARTVDYAVRGADGKAVSHGSLSSSAGSFTLALPTTTHATSYDVSLRAHGPFGDDVRALHVVALAPPPKARPTIAHVDAVKLAQASVYSGKPLRVWYHVAADRGSLQLVDQSGTVRASVPLRLRNGAGSSTLDAPVTADDQEFRVLVRAELGQTVAEQSVGLTIKGDPALAATMGVVPANIAIAQDVDGSVGPNGDTTTSMGGVAVVDMHGGTVNESITPLTEPPFKVLASPIGSGDLIRVQITHSEPHLQLALTAPSGDIVSQVMLHPRTDAGPLPSAHRRQGDDLSDHRNLRPGLQPRDVRPYDGDPAQREAFDKRPLVSMPQAVRAVVAGSVPLSGKTR